MKKITEKTTSTFYLKKIPPEFTRLGYETTEKHVMKHLCPVHMLFQGNIYTGGRLLYPLCSCQPTVELAVGVLENIFCNK